MSQMTEDGTSWKIDYALVFSRVFFKGTEFTIFVCQYIEDLYLVEAINYNCRIRVISKNTYSYVN